MAGSQSLPARSRLRLASGIELSFLDWGGPGPVILLHHGTGFCADIWRCVADRLSERYRVIALDARGHGESDKPEAGYHWQVIAADVHQFVDRLLPDLGVNEVALGVGHSFGAAALLLAAEKNPTSFGALALLDPILLTEELYAAQGVRADGTHRLSLVTRMRQARFPSRESTRQSLRSTQLFAPWHQDVFEDYLEYGFNQHGDGSLTLKCPPAIEAQFFEMGQNHGLFQHQPLRLPMLVVRASAGWLQPADYLPFEHLLGGARSEEMSSGHSIPMEQPERTAARIERFMQELGY